MRTGKSTSAAHLKSKYGLNKVIEESFAAKLKDIVKDLYKLTEEHVEGSLKNTPVEYCDGMTPREILQKVGVYHREINPNVWVDSVFNRIVSLENKLIIITDCRFPNEAERIKKEGGILIRIDRINREGVLNENHISDVALNDYKSWDFIIDNNSSFENLYGQLDNIMTVLGYLN